jgi:hypothetical protein
LINNPGPLTLRNYTRWPETLITRVQDGAGRTRHGPPRAEDLHREATGPNPTRFTGSAVAGNRYRGCRWPAGHRRFAVTTASPAPTNRHCQPILAHARPVASNVATSRDWRRSTGRQTITGADPSRRQAVLQRNRPNLSERQPVGSAVFRHLPDLEASRFPWTRRPEVLRDQHRHTFTIFTVDAPDPPQTRQRRAALN